MKINNPNIKKGRFQESLKKDLSPERLVIIKAGNRKRIPITIVEGKKNIPIMNKTKPQSSRFFSLEK